MTVKNRITIVMLVIVNVVLSSDKKIKYDSLVIDTDTIHIKEDINKIGINELKKYLGKARLLSEKSGTYSIGKIINKTVTNGKIYVAVDEKQKQTKISNLQKYGISSIVFNRNETINRIEFRTEEERPFTKKEYGQFRKTGKLPESYCKLTEIEAISLAKKFIKENFSESELKFYDSTHVIYTPTEYLIVFSKKIKNNIKSFSIKKIWIKANTGQINKYSGSYVSILTKEDYKYSPTINKEMAIKTFTDLCNEMRKEIAVNELFLVKDTRTKSGTPRWKWWIFGENKKENKLRRPMIIIDSENGEIIKKDL